LSQKLNNVDYSLVFSRLLPSFILAAILLSAFKADAFCITAAEAKLREAPNPRAKVTWTVGKYTPLITLKWQGNWVQVEDMDGDTHWVHGSSGREKLQCVAIKSPVAKLRTSAAASAPLADLRQVDRYTGFKRVDRIEEWFQLEAPWGAEYWVHESNVWRPVKVQTIGF
jgi:SH3-like domain-containing protein